MYSVFYVNLGKQSSIIARNEKSLKGVQSKGKEPDHLAPNIWR